MRPSSATSLLLTQEHGVWPENSIAPSCQLSRNQMLANSHSSPHLPVQEPLAGQIACMKGDSARQQCQASASPLSCPPDPLCPGSAQQIPLASGPSSSSFLCLESSLPTPNLFLPWLVPINQNLAEILLSQRRHHYLFESDTLL